MARKFLYVIAFLLALVLAAGAAWTLYADRMIRFAMQPTTAFAPLKLMPVNAYTDVRMWYARPEIANNPALWTPDSRNAESRAGTAPVAVFFIHPTSFLAPRPAKWNAALADADASTRAELFIRGQASAFNGIGDVWAPRYRQAAFGAFLTTQPDAARALDAAYTDVAMAFDAFISHVPKDRPIVLAGHSQGALHLMRLLRERVAGKPVAARVVAAYVVGWPVSVETDVTAMGLPVCARVDQSGCILSWQSFAEPADTKAITDVYDATTGFDGRSRRGTAMLCTNPLTGVPGTSAPATANLGAVIPAADLKTGTLEPGTIPARCDPRGFLLIGAPPKGIDAYVLPGNNYHVFDYSLFWSNVRQDVARRYAAFAKASGGTRP